MARVIPSLRELCSVVPDERGRPRGIDVSEARLSELAEVWPVPEILAEIEVPATADRGILALLVLPVALGKARPSPEKTLAWAATLVAACGSALRAKVSLGQGKVEQRHFRAAELAAQALVSMMELDRRRGPPSSEVCIQHAALLRAAAEQQRQQDEALLRAALAASLLGAGAPSAAWSLLSYAARVFRRRPAEMLPLATVLLETVQAEDRPSQQRWVAFDILARAAEELPESQRDPFIQARERALDTIAETIADEAVFLIEATGE